MRYLVLLSLFAIINFHAASQVDSNSIKTKDYYLQKSKSQKTAAWVFVGAGAATALIGVIVANSSKADDDFSTSFDNAVTGSGLIVIGAASCLASIPFFIVSGNNKRRALALSSGFQQIPMPANGLTIKQPVISVSITIGR